MPYDFQPNLLGGLNNDIKKISPDGTIELYSNSLMQPAQGVPDVAKTERKEPGTGFLGIPGWFQGAGESINAAFSNPLLPMMLGQLGAQIAEPGTWQSRLGQGAAQHFQNILFNQLLTSSLGGGTNPFVSGSAALGSGVAGLTPEQQSQILSIMMAKERGGREAELLPYQQFGTYAQGVRDLNYRPAGPAPTRGIVTEINVDESGKQTSARNKHRWLVDPTSGERMKYLGPATQITPTPSDSTARQLGIGDVEKLLTQEFYTLAEKNITETSGLEEATKILDALGDPETGAVQASKLMPHLTNEQRIQYIGALRDYAPEAKNPTSIKKLADRLEKEFVEEEVDTGGYDVGDVIDIDGTPHKYKGGDFNDIKNWEKVK